jgi:DNA-directed RNA polymerase subunit beta
MSYSYTEKKRIRKNFGTFAKVMDLPNLIETQTNSYSEFLQADVAPEATLMEVEHLTYLLVH